MQSHFHVRISKIPHMISASVAWKSAVLNYINGCKMKGIEYNRADIAASFQKAVTDVLVDNAMHE